MALANAECDQWLYLQLVHTTSAVPAHDMTAITLDIEQLLTAGRCSSCEEWDETCSAKSKQDERVRPVCFSTAAR